MKYKNYYNLLLVSLLVVFFNKHLNAQTGTLQIKEDPKISDLLHQKKVMEKENIFSDGYTIQLYYGEKTKDNSVLRKNRNTYGDWPASIKYETPNYKVWAGNFSSRLEADRALIEIKRHFSSAFILKPKKKKK
jgi:hypothetical protein